MPFGPFGPFFAIWLLIFASCFGFALHFAVQGGAPAVGWLAAALFAGNVWWERHVPRRGLDRISVAIIVLELALAIALLAMTARGAAAGWDWWLGVAPLQLFAGWVSVATFANLSSTLKAEGRAVRAPALLLVAGALAATAAFWSGSWPYAAAAAWGLAGAAVSATLKGDRAAIGAAAPAAALTLLAPLA